MKNAVKNLSIWLHGSIFAILPLLLVVIVAFPLTVYAQDIGRTAGGEIPGKPLQELQMQIDELRAKLESALGKIGTLAVDLAAANGKINTLEDNLAAEIAARQAAILKSDKEKRRLAR